MFFMIYVSSARELFSQSDLLYLLAVCNRNNAKQGITGMLLYKEGSFMQVLEGEESTVRQVYQKIAADPRHHGEIVLLEGQLEERQFPEWSMGFRNLNSSEVQAVPGYNEFLNTKLRGDEFSSNPTRAHKLLLSFKKSM